jgi:hypothetical protein
MDIETITLKDLDSLQVPVVISSYIPNEEGINEGNKLFIIDYKSLEVAINNKDYKNIDVLVTNLWKEYLDYLATQPVKTIFAHNLGSFDGVFL